MKLIATAPLAIALLALAACGSQDGTSGGPIGSVEGKAAPEGTTWSQTVAETPEGGMVMGNPDAPIKLVEFASYTCSHCAQFSAQSHDELEGTLVNSGKVSLEIRNYVANPLDISVALLARCAGPEAFFSLTHQFFANQAQMFDTLQSAGENAYQNAMTAPPAERFERLAEAAGLIQFAMQRGIPEDKARACLADSKTVDALAAAVERDTAKYDIAGTPTILMNDTKLDITTWPALSEHLKNAGA